MKEYFTQTIQHDSVTPYQVVPPRPGKRQAHQQPSQKMSRSVSAIRLNDSNKSSFTIGHENRIFSKQETLTSNINEFHKSQRRQRSQSQCSMVG